MLQPHHQRLRELHRSSTQMPQIRGRTTRRHQTATISLGETAEREGAYEQAEE
uniref:Uncharacterized protein n=1 Tax=Arundo donax TaxID=35708 RepID=A0A0A9E149_ARUDO